ncbi:MAG: FHA domain-containing protein [Candidatus Eremiobacteraeota bacterium]|nr:FHA domain-containing protein [Candidatus Eremiobacteraeota bacterium]MCW5868368.1 FHA domain-containing protein [Candidatus Eremiobacteraeota bacterium]
MECPKCRQYNLPGSSYCEKCGFHLRSLQRQSQSHHSPYSPSAPSARPVPAPAPVPNYPGAAPPPPPPPAAQARPRAAQPAPPPPPPKPAAPPAYAHLRELPQGRQLPLIYDRSLVGRLSEADGVKPEIDLADFGEGGVSRRHAQIVRAEGQVYLEDLSSSNGTFLNGVRLQPGLQSPLKHQDEVRFGSLRFQYWHSQA